MQASTSMPGNSVSCDEALTLVPLLELPRVDLRTSVKSHLPLPQRLQRAITVLAGSTLPLVGFVLHLVLCAVIVFVDESLGAVLAPISLLLGLPGTVIAILCLRYDMLVTLARTYDICFFGLVATVAAAFFGPLLGDHRAMATIPLWLSFLINIFIDANIHWFHSLWVLNCFSAVGLIVMAATIGFGLAPTLYEFNAVEVNKHTLSAVAVVRDGLVTMGVIALRNVFRRYNTVMEKLDDNDPSHTRPLVIRCVSFRCRLKVVPLARGPELIRHEVLQRPHDSGAPRVSHDDVKTPLRFVPDQEAFDPRLTLFPFHRFSTDRSADDSSPWSSWMLTLWQILGAFGLVTTSVLVVVDTAVPDTPFHLALDVLAFSAAGVTLLFTHTCLAHCHRQLFRAVVTSFDFLYTMTQLFILAIAFIDLNAWRKSIIAVSLSVSWWTLWGMTWDAVTPSTRKRLGITTRHVAWCVSTLSVTMVVTGVLIFVVLPPDKLHDHALFRVRVFHQVVEFRAFAWYFSCAMTIATWVVRHCWRLWHAVDDELVVLDGTVVFDISRPRRDVPSSNTQQVMPIPIASALQPIIPYRRLLLVRAV